MRLFLLRHGETEANARGVFCGQTDLPLTPTGIRQAQQVAGYLADVDFHHATSSQLQRAIHTANIVLAERPLAVQTNSQLNEMDFGDWEMRHHQDLQQQDPIAWAAWVADWQQAAPTGGESFPQFSARIEQIVPTLLQTREGRDVQQLLVAHQGVLSLLLARLLGMPATAMWHFPFEQGAYSLVEIDSGFARLRAFNSKTVI